MLFSFFFVFLLEYVNPYIVILGNTILYGNTNKLLLLLLLLLNCTAKYSLLRSVGD